MSSSNSTAIALADSQYGYVPHEYVAIIFVVLFGISTITHVGQAIYYRMWWLLITACLCGMGELVGWSGRLWSSFSPSLANPYMMQITATILSPTPLIAVNFNLAAWIVIRMGTCYSWLTPIWYTVIFVSCDIIALVIQGAGGGIAAGATTLSATNLGANIMLAGIVFQFVAVIAYSSLAADFLRRYSKDLPVRPVGANDARGLMDPKLKTMIAALAFSTLVLCIRAIYRVIELGTGWDGRVIHTELYFNVLDGGMVVLAIFTINFAHPGRLIGTRRPQARPYEEEKMTDDERSSSGTSMRKAA
ncbi:RTA1-like protein [Mycena galericulata]|nr:RTA1-like protein [Mycena galericulata]